MSARNSAPLVGRLVRVARPVGGGPINYDGHTGRVLDVAQLSREALVAFDSGEHWVPLANVIPVEVTVDYDDSIEPRGEELITPRVTIAERAHVAEHEGHDEHLDAIEAGLMRRLTAASADRATQVGLDRLAAVTAGAGIGQAVTHLAASINEAARREDESAREAALARPTYDTERSFNKRNAHREPRP